MPYLLDSSKTPLSDGTSVRTKATREGSANLEKFFAQMYAPKKSQEHKAFNDKVYEMEWRIVQYARKSYHKLVANPELMRRCSPQEVRAWWNVWSLAVYFAVSKKVLAMTR